MQTSPVCNLLNFGAQAPIGSHSHSWLASISTNQAAKRCRRNVPRASGANVPLIKICGITSVEDAKLAVGEGADMIGMIMWQGAKRAVDAKTAAAIAKVARDGGAVAVGVFVDEDYRQITQRCEMAGIDTAQLHGEGARASLHLLPTDLEVIYVMHATPDGALQTAPPPDKFNAGLYRQVEWVLIDGMQGGSGETLDWARLAPPSGCGIRGWVLAGGLTPGNVQMAVSLSAPAVVDVSSGVCGPDGLVKDALKIRQFIAATKL